MNPMVSKNVLLPGSLIRLSTGRRPFRWMPLMTLRLIGPRSVSYTHLEMNFLFSSKIFLRHRLLCKNPSGFCLWSRTSFGKRKIKLPFPAASAFLFSPRMVTTFAVCTSVRISRYIRQKEKEKTPAAYTQRRCCILLWNHIIPCLLYTSIP